MVDKEEVLIMAQALKMLKSKAFTMIELMMTVVVLTIIVSIAIVNYQGYRDRVAMMVDETNQKILHAAVRMNAADTGTIAASISELRPVDLERAYALVVHPKMRPYTMLAHLKEQWSGFWGGTVEADNFLPSQYYDKQLKVIQCLSDPTPPTGFDQNGKPTGGTSYIIHPQASGKPYSWFVNSDNAEKYLMIEADSLTDGSEIFRHGKKKWAVFTTVGGKSKRHHREGNSQRGGPGASLVGGRN